MLQASSPDEIALVKFAEDLGFVLRLRDKNELVIEDPSNQ